MVWKGKRPPFEDPSLASNSGNTLSVVGRRGSIGSTGSSESISTDGSSESLSSLPLAPAVPVENVERGSGVIAKILDEACGLIWWPIRPNHYQSVWFDRKHTFLYGMNLAQHDLGETFRQGNNVLHILHQFVYTFPCSGDPVNFICVRTNDPAPTRWVARQVLVTDKGNSPTPPNAFNSTPPHLAVGGPRPIGMLG